MGEPQEISAWIEQARRGERQAAEQLLRCYFRDLVRLAKNHLRASARRAGDEEDVALSAFDSVYRGLEAQRFPDLQHRGNLWGLLFFKTVTKALNWDKHEALRHPPLSDEDVVRMCNDGLAGREPSAAEAAALADDVRKLLQMLPDTPTAPLGQVARLLLDGHSTKEIAGHLKCLVADVERFALTIWSRWRKAV